MADPAQRVVHEINGEPAADAYAEMLGVELDELNSDLFSKNPIMLRNGDDYYIRSLRSVNADHSLSFFCAMEQGLVLTIGKHTPTRSRRSNAALRVTAGESLHPR